MPRFVPVTDSFMVAAQLTPADFVKAREDGVGLVICNRPDGEAPDQPTSAAMADAARAAGLEFKAIPVQSSGFTMDDVEAMAQTLRRTRGKALAYCRTGTRSTMLWALAQAKLGQDPETLSQQVSAAGYNCTSIRPTMDLLHKG